MGKKVLLGLLGLVVGGILAYCFVLQPHIFTSGGKITLFDSVLRKPQKKIVGFLPFWLVSKAQANYSDTVTTLNYFALILGEDGHIKKLSSPTESEPGWHALNSGKIDSILDQATLHKTTLSLTVFSADTDEINSLVSDPVQHATHVADDVIPVMKKYGFSELNLDIETVEDASSEARANFTKFTKELSSRIKKDNYSLMVDISGRDLIKPNLIDVEKIGEIADHVLVMTYDFHYAGSIVSGAVAPLGGAGINAEYDVRSAISLAQKVIPPQKIILGVPLYGYEWETVTDIPRTGIIPGTGLTASSMRVEQLLSGCSTCSAHFDKEAMESYIIYRDENTSTYHQLYYPDSRSSQAKLDFMEEQGLGGIGLWALGYESEKILEPFNEYNK